MQKSFTIQIQIYGPLKETLVWLQHFDFTKQDICILHT